MKTCPVCSETYLKCIDYCFRDGAVLISPGDEPEFEETEKITHSVVSRMKPEAQAHKKKSPDEVTEPFEFANVELSEPVLSEEVPPKADEELEAPQALGNTQMFRKEDLLAMFDDDSTFNGEMISEDENEDYEIEADTEELEATETFSLEIKEEPEKTEHEKIEPIIQISSAPSVPAPSPPSPSLPPSPAAVPAEPSPSPQVEPTVKSGPPLWVGVIIGVLIAFTILLYMVLQELKKHNQTQQNPVPTQQIQLEQPEQPEQPEVIEKPVEDTEPSVQEQVVDPSNNEEEVQEQPSGDTEEAEVEEPTEETEQ